MKGASPLTATSSSLPCISGVLCDYSEGMGRKEHALYWGWRSRNNVLYTRRCHLGLNIRVTIDNQLEVKVRLKDATSTIALLF